MIKHIKLPYETKIPHRIRYIINRCGTSNVNSGSHWVKIQVFDKNGNNIAPNGTASIVPNGRSTSFAGGASWQTMISSEAPVTAAYLAQDPPSTGLKIDLGDIYEVDHITIYHYWGDSRTYYNHSTLISADGNVWYEIMEPQSYTETSSGKTLTW